jgi:hypothetical protein
LLSAVVPVQEPSDPLRELADSEPGPTLRPVGPAAAAEQGGILLRFPLRGEALLVKLADLLKSRIASGEARYGSERNRLVMTISRCPGSRLSIDRRAYVEFDAVRSVYRMTIEAALDTTVTLDTTDFDTLVNFVLQYVAGRLSRPATLEVAS